MALRRGRDRLLEAAHARLHEEPRGRRTRAYLLAAALFAALALAVAIHLGHRAVSVADIVASAGARWERHTTSSGERVSLVDGELTLRVRRSATDPRVVVRVPDGTIDDVGTVFSVTVHEGHTTEIRVREGAVVFRHDGGALLLKSPSSWSAAPAVPAPPASTTPPGQAAQRDAETAPAVRRTSPVKPRRAPPASPAPSEEDLAYLRIVALRREGRTDEARLAAAEYLRSFPDGFRRADVLAFVRAPR
jgi:ferric-dicitrate binding protein FerR (iron transport regulator)